MRVLIVDDEPSLRQTLSVILAEEGYEVATATHGRDALEQLRARAADLILCDLRMPVLDGMGFLDGFKKSGCSGLVIVMSAYGDADTAIEAMQRGAHDYLEKPFRAEEVILVVRKAAERERSRGEVRRIAAGAPPKEHEELIGGSGALRAVTELALKVAPHPSTVLVTGESGTGKELVARLIHRASSRADGSFVAVNCGAIPEPLLESELFGHVKGAFTGAATDKAGLFEEADGGTLFLDEIGELPQMLQVKLLRALQEAEVRRVGANTGRKVDVRVIAATNRDLGADVAAGRFRADLFYRINVVAIALPALRDRREDIPELASAFLTRFAARLGVSPGGITAEAMRVLTQHSWPGNVRELENVIERALVLTGGQPIAPEHLPAPVHAGAPATSAGADDLSIKRRTAALERTLIRRALAHTGGNRTRAAQLLELSHRALLYKIREYGIE